MRPISALRIIYDLKKKWIDIVKYRRRIEDYLVHFSNAQLKC